MHGFSESVKSKLEGGTKGYDLVNEVLMVSNGVGEYCK